VAEQTSSGRDPFGMWREWLSQSERQWNSFFNDVMGSQPFNETQGRLMEMYLAMQKAMGEAMGRSLTALDIPTRTDVLGLGERLSVIENRLTTIEAHLARLAGSSGDTASPTPTPVPRPARTRQPGMP
jgi:hypothetical protein